MLSYVLLATLHAHTHVLYTHALGTNTGAAASPEQQHNAASTDNPPAAGDPTVGPSAEGLTQGSASRDKHLQWYKDKFPDDATGTSKTILLPPDISRILFPDFAVGASGVTAADESADGSSGNAAGGSGGNTGGKRKFGLPAKTADTIRNFLSGLNKEGTKLEQRKRELARFHKVWNIQTTLGNIQSTSFRGHSVVNFGEHSVNFGERPVQKI
jgi:hypothetical protein